MKNLSPKVKILTLLWGLGSLIAAGLSIAATATHFEKGSNYYTRGALPTAALVVALLAGLCGIALAILHKPDPKQSPFYQKPIPAPAAIGFLCVLPALVIGFPAATVQLGANGTAFNMVPVLGILAVLSLLYGILVAIPSIAKKSSSWLAFLGMCAMLTCLFLTAYYYFDISVEMNAPLKTLLQVGLLLSMLYFTGEIRYFLGTPMPRTFLALGTLTVSVGALAAVAIPYAYLTGKLARIDYLAGAILLLTVAITAAIRVVTLLTAEPPVEDNTTAVLPAGEDIPASPDPSDDPTDHN